MPTSGPAVHGPRRVRSHVADLDPVSALSFDELAWAARNGDRRALDAFLAAARPVITRTCIRLVDRASADDLVQETCLRIVRSLPGFRGRSAISWLLTITRRVCANEIAARQRQRATFARLCRQPVDAVDGVVDDAAGWLVLADVVAHLEAARREAFTLTALAGLSYAEAAQQLRCPVGTIRSRVSRARADLLTQLRDDAGALRLPLAG